MERDDSFNKGVQTSDCSVSNLREDEGFVDSVLANVEESGGELSFEEFVELLQLD